MIKNTGVFSMPQSNGAFTTYGVKVYDSYAEMQADTPPNIQLGLIKGANTVYRFENGVWVIGFPQVNDSRDYTAWEIMCNYEQVYGAIESSGYQGDYNERTGYYYAKSLTYTNGDQGTTAKFILRTTTTQDKQDVVVDWGDGTFSSVRNGDFESVSASGYSYTMSHKYAEPAEFDKEVITSDTKKYRKTKRYTIKVYGTQYYGFAYTNLGSYNLMCRCLDWDLPIASHVVNISSFAYGSRRLQKVDIPFTKYLKNFINYSSTFEGCHNLISVSGFANYTNKSIYTCSCIFKDCNNMIECDFILPELSNGFYGAYYKCSKFPVDIATLFPKQGFLGKTYSVKQLFASTQITGTVPAHLLWEDSSIEWTNTADAFSDCPDEIRAQVPVSWGGTMEEPSTEA